jgi:phosphate starvation-inducible PhoH-like protein
MEPRNPSQRKFLHLLQEKTIHVLVGAGAAGTGKTHCAVHTAVRALCGGHVSRIVLTRPAVPAGEDIGFLPGDMHSKLDPYLRPLFDVLYRYWTPKDVQRLIDAKLIEVVPLAFMRGLTLSDAFVIADEMQNASRAQVLMLLTRIGPNSKFVVLGDPDQHDRLAGNQESGLVDLLRRCERSDTKIQGVRVFRFGASDVVRHPVVATLLALYQDNQPPPLQALTHKESAECNEEQNLQQDQPTTSLDKIIQT